MAGPMIWQKEAGKVDLSYLLMFAFLFLPKNGDLINQIIFISDYLYWCSPFAKLYTLIFGFIFQNIKGVNQCCNLEVHIRETYINGGRDQFWYIQIHIWLHGVGEKNKRNHLEAEQWTFLLVYSSSLAAKYEFQYIENGLLNSTNL